jgi:hypothetical protein
MVSIASLWAPILLSAVLVFLVSSVLHMMLTYHRADYTKVPDEDKVMDALRPFNLAPGDYMMPCGGGPESMKDPVFIEKMKRGPVAHFTVLKSGTHYLASSLAQWFLYSVGIGICAAYITGRALGPGAHYLTVFRFAGATAFIGYGAAQLQNSIWYKRRWSTTLKHVFDSLIYASVTAGAFGWLWPR